MQITTLIENLVYQQNLLAEHGLSFYLEGESRKILFDTGQTGNFIHNASVLGVNLTDVDALVISHGHYDHTGGIYPFLKINKKATVYIKKEAFLPKYHGPERFIGVTYDSPLEKRIQYVTEPVEIDTDVFIMPDIPVKYPEDTNYGHLQVKVGDKLIEDTFEDELYLAVTENKLLSVISSCSHRGIINILEAAKTAFDLPVDTVMGGFHIRANTEEKLSKLEAYFRQLSPRSIGVCHCSGVEKYAWLLQRFGQQVFYNYTGKVVLLNG
ncbi:MAG: MBL fold metallo-hydrolase [Bacteroidales bacterium]|nr:MBL fold metallo-hydrolase [Bacteroidales bacterium]